MKETIKSFIAAYKSDYGFKTLASSTLSAVIGIAFTFYNGFLGAFYSSIWNGTICVYYVLLASVRAFIVNSQAKINANKIHNAGQYVKKVYIISHIMFLIINLSLIIPITVMIRGDRTYRFGLIPSIAMAAYTTYRVTMAVINFRKSRRMNDPLTRALRNISLIDTLVSVLVLQNTLILANEGEITESMARLSICTSTAIWIIIFAISAVSFTKVKSLNNK